MEREERIESMLREVIRIGYSGLYAERICSLNRARNLLTELNGMEYVDAGELIKEK